MARIPGEQDNAMISTDRSELLAAARAAQGQAVSWLLDQLDDGRPREYAVKNTWWRLPWALSVAGADAEAAAVLDWAEAEAVDGAGELRAGPGEFSPGSSPVYELAALAIGAWRLGRTGLATTLLDRSATFQSPHTGGVYDRRDRAEGTEQDLLKTAQLGVAAVVAGRRDLADPAAQWVRELWALQPETPRVLYPMRDDSAALVVPPAPVAPADLVRSFFARVDFTAPFQAYYNPGIAAAFLTGYAALTATPEDHALALEFLRLNREGADVQFDDPHSVQICKYAWGVAAVLGTGAAGDDEAGWLGEAERMTRWFLDRRNDDGSWSPSTFGSHETPPPVERLWKTAEHLMELTFLIDRLTADPARPSALTPGAAR